MIRTRILHPDGRIVSGDGTALALTPPADAVVWVDLLAPDPDVLAALGRHWHFHPLALEDCVHPQRRAKYERYAAHGFLVLMALDRTTPEELDTLALRVFHRHGLVVTVRDGPVQAVERVAAALEQGELGGACSTDRLVHLLVDALVDDLGPVLDQYEERVDDLEARVTRETSTAVVHALVELRHDLLHIRRITLPHQEVVRRLMDSPEMAEDSRLYFRDVLDHLMALGDGVTLLLEVCNGAMQVHDNAVSERTNAVMKYLALVSTLLLPMTVISGAFGMNFDVIPLSAAPWGFWSAVGLMLLSAAVLLFWFRRKRWL